MEKLPCSIFNDVLGPVMRGPSSSHVAGAARRFFHFRCTKPCSKRPSYRVGTRRRPQSYIRVTGGCYL